MRRNEFHILPFRKLAFKKKKKLEMLAEEMRVLYVALTRAKEKLFLLSSVKELDKKIADWEKSLSNKGWLLKEYERAAAKSYLDWIGPALIRHRDADILRGIESTDKLVPAEIYEHSSSWKIEFMKANDLIVREKEKLPDENDLMGRVYQGLTVEIESNWKEEIKKN